MALSDRISQFYRRRWQKWLDRRIPREQQVTLNQRRIFIFLTRQGFIAGIVVLALFIGGINYANNLLLATSFFLASLFVIAIHHTYANLSGLRITALSASPAFAGEEARFLLRLDDVREREHESLLLEWDGVVQPVPWVNAVQDVAVALPAPKRGWLRPPRLKISSTYPLGLLRAWTWLDLDLAAIVYPHPESSEVIPAGPGRDGEGERQRTRGHEDFDGLKDFTPGDPLAHVSWKHLARGRGMLTKTYASEEAGSDILDWNAMPGLPIETRLSRLAFWVVLLAQHNHAFGLRLPGTDIPAGLGIEQRDACLRALALFGREEKPK
ncbi:MAG: hypothetical protein K0S46_868 [Moraxellaceae bacterium]|jgi:uncharacterized protein (DUF58 family)|nr:hypothetical protein [Moraxellaceae bacterium]